MNFAELKNNSITVLMQKQSNVVVRKASQYTNLNIICTLSYHKRSRCKAAGFLHVRSSESVHQHTFRSVQNASNKCLRNFT